MISIDNVYFQLIKAGRKTIDQVPAQNREAVQKLFDAEKAPSA